MTTAAMRLPGSSRRSPRLVASLGAILLAVTIAVLVGGPRGPLVGFAVLFGVLLLIMLIRPELATVFFVAALYLNLPAILPQFYGVPAILAAGIVGILLIPIGAFAIRRQPIVVNGVLGPVLVYLAAMLTAAAVSGRPTESLGAIGIFLTEGLLIVVLVTNVIRSLEAATRVIWTLVVAGAVLGGLSVLQELTGTHDFAYGGLAQMNESFPAEDGIRIPEPDRQQRLAGPIGETNRYAQIMLMLFPLALSRVRAEPSRLLRLVAIGSAVLILGGTFLTLSRGAAVALALLLVIMVGWRYIRGTHLLLLGLLILVVVTIVAPPYIARIGSLQGAVALVGEGDRDEADGAIVGRATSNLASFLVFVDHPITGVGPGRYAVRYSAEYANELGLRYFEGSRRAHNLYLEIAAETGFLGLAAFLASVGWVVLGLIRERRWWLGRDRRHAELAAAFALALLAYLATGIFLHLSYQRYYWFMLAVAAAVLWVLRREHQRFEFARERRRA